ncbi:SNF5-domain-containing protein [Armillaria gallica]|uniref:SNF5-domain-containing protein n=1 Tax=Armillaria gallica TaxID=47427 RepID=A0A2H3DTF8_ARMGA|nr:SNF5-domain-containing protein [Armillaria gallica]
MADNQNSTFPTSFGNMSDVQLGQTINQLSTAARTYAPTPLLPQTVSKAYVKNLHAWTTTATPPPKNAATGARSTRARGANRSTNLTNTPTPTTTYTPQIVYQQAAPQPPVQPVVIQAPPPPNPPRSILPTTPQALISTYSSRLKTGATLLMQPILASTSSNTASTSTRAATRRGGVVNYADPGSGDDLPDAGALDSDDSDFIASGGTRTAIRQQGTSTRSRMNAGMSVFNSTTGVTTIRQQSTPPPPPPPLPEKTELDQSYLGQVPPSRYITARPFYPTPHTYASPDVLAAHSERRTSLVPIRVEFETETHRIRDCFVWNLYENIIRPEMFAKTFCNDLDLPIVPWAETVANQIKAQLEDHEGIAMMDLGIDGAVNGEDDGREEVAECRVILSIDVQIATHHLLDHIEWDLLSPLTPEAFSTQLCADLGLSGEAVPLVAHAIHEELIRHKKDAAEWGVIGDVIDKSGVVKDKTGLNIGWGGNRPKVLQSVWRDWADAQEFATRFEELSAEEVERREIERERATRRLRRETSKFQSSTRSRRR